MQLPPAAVQALQVLVVLFMAPLVSGVIARVERGQGHGEAPQGEDEPPAHDVAHVPERERKVG